MGPLDATWHLLNLLAPALSVGMLSAVGAKLIWRRELGAVPWRRLASATSGASAVVLVAGLVLTGRDGRMIVYAAMVLACAAALAWVGFGPGRR